MDYTRIQVPRMGIYTVPVNIFKAVLYIVCVIIVVLSVWWFIDGHNDNKK